MSKLIYYSPFGGTALAMFDFTSSKDAGHDEQQAAIRAYEKDLDRSGQAFATYTVADKDAPTVDQLPQARIRRGPDGKLRVEVDRTP